MDRRWQAVLASLPDQRLAKCWNLEKGEILPEKIDAYIAKASSGERHLAKFLANVWCGSRRDECQPGGPWHFDFVDAMGTLEGSFKRVVSEWAQKPYYP